MTKSHDLIELNIAEDLKEILEKEVTKLKIKLMSGTVDKMDLMALEKLTKTYTLLMADLRESVKSGVFGDLPETALEGLIGGQRAQEKSPRGRGRPKKS